MPTSTKTARTMISGASKLAKRTSKATVWLFCRHTTTTSAMRIPMIQARQLVGFFSCGPTGQILDALPDLAVGLISVQPPFRHVLRLSVLTLLTNPFVRLVLIIGMGSDSGQGAKVTLVTLGPTGTCHERAAIEYMAFQGVEDFEIRFT